MLAPRVFRASASAYALLCGPWLGLTLFWVWLSLPPAEPQFAALLFCFVPGVGFALWLATFRLEFSSGAVVYRAPFAGTWRLPTPPIDLAGPLPVEARERRSLWPWAPPAPTIHWKVFPRAARRRFEDLAAATGLLPG